MLLLFQFFTLVFCKDLPREECINPESVKLDDLFCGHVWKEEARMAISDSQMDLVNDLSCPPTDCYDTYTGSLYQNSLPFRQNAKPITKTSRNGRISNYGYSSSSDSNCLSLPSIKKSWATKASPYSWAPTIAPVVQDDPVESNGPYSWASNVDYIWENVDYFPVMGRRRKRALAPFYDSQAEYSSNYDTYPHCDNQDGSDSSSNIGAPIDYGEYNIDEEKMKYREDLKKLSERCGQKSERFIIYQISTCQL